MAEVKAAVLDADVLVPMPLCDTLLRAAAADLFRPHWSTETIAEVERTLIKLGREAAKARRRVLAMRQAYPDAEVDDYADRMAYARNQQKDRHVVAAAFAANASLIVTRNLRDFSPLPPGIEAASPDDFLCELLDNDADLLIDCLVDQADAMRKPPASLSELLARLRHMAPTFAARAEDLM